MVITRKHSFLLMDSHILDFFELKKSKQKTRLSVRPVRGHNNLWRSLRIQTKFGMCLLYIKCSSGIEIQRNIQIEDFDLVFWRKVSLNTLLFSWQSARDSRQRSPLIRFWRFFGRALYRTHRVAFPHLHRSSGRNSTRNLIQSFHLETQNFSLIQNRFF